MVACLAYQPLIQSNQANSSFITDFLVGSHLSRPTETLPEACRSLINPKCCKKTVYTPLNFLSFCPSKVLLNLFYKGHTLGHMHRLLSVLHICVIKFLQICQGIICIYRANPIVNFTFHKKIIQGHVLRLV